MNLSDQESLLPNYQKKEISSLLGQYKYEWVDNAYKFTTEFGYTYSVYFLTKARCLYAEYEHWRDWVYEMGFEVVGRLPKDHRYDERVTDTILCIIDTFFSTKENVLLYTCESLDDGGELRYRLFNQWYFKSGKKEEFEKLDYDASFEDTKIFTTMIFARNHPYEVEISDAFFWVCQEIYNY